jgi:hypothetical protein
MRCCFAKRVVKTAPAPSKEQLMELIQKKNGSTSEVEPCQTGPNSLMIFFNSGTDVNNILTIIYDFCENFLVFIFFLLSNVFYYED